MTDREVSLINRAIGANYDALVYDPIANPLLDATRVCGLASLFSGLTPAADVLDLGCGTGRQLLRLADQVAGRLVGTDISQQACRKASERLAPFGERARIIHADLLELSAEQLGEFDLIYNIGVIYMVPPEVRHHILALIGGCLRPGGVAVLSYYAGSVAAVRAQLHRMLRATCRGIAPEAAIPQARKNLDALAESVREKPGVALLRGAIAVTKRQSDVIFFHEVFNGAFEPLQTTELEGELAKYGLSFAGYLPPAGSATEATSLERAVAADASDLLAGRYRFAVFAKELPAVDGFAARPDRWESNFRRDQRGEYTGEQVFTHRSKNQSATIRNPASMAMFDCLMDEPLSWPVMVEKVGGILAANGIEFAESHRRAMERDLRETWLHGFVSPLARMARGDV